MRALSLFVFFVLSLPIIDSQGTNKYYTSPGNSTGQCTIANCNPNCPANQYLLGCTFNSSGACTNCVNTLTSGNYYSLSGGYSSTCTQASCTLCSTGQYTANCAVPNTSPGTCTACSTVMTLNARSNWNTYSGPTYTCSQQAWPTCTVGQTNPTASTTNNGLCVACTNTVSPGYTYDPAQQNTAITACPTVLCTAGCSNGQSTTGCTPTTAGTCTSCGTPPTNNYWTAYGGTTYVCTSASWTLCSVGYTNNAGTTTSAGSCSPCTNTPAAGSTYVTTPQYVAPASCATTTCTAGCSAGSYTSGCTSTTAGSCISCGTPPSGYYYGAYTGPTQTCAQAQYALPTCAAGQYLSGNTSTSPGSCLPCGNTAPTAGYYWNPAQQYTSTCSILQCSAPAQYQYFTTAGACTTAAMTSCPAGQYNSNLGTNIYSAGTCTTCPLSYTVYYTANTNVSSNCPSSPCLGNCGVGFFRGNCGGTTTATSAGACAACTGANSTQQYTTTGGNGGLTDACTVTGCSLACQLGQYISGCGGPVTGLSCQWCTNSVANIKYYSGVGSYTPISCPTLPCPVFENGYYNMGCYNTSQGVPAICTNT